MNRPVQVWPRAVASGVAMVAFLGATAAHAQVFEPLNSFTGCPLGCGGQADGGLPSSTLVADSLGFLYGTAQDGMPGAKGTIYRVNEDGSRTLMFNFNDGPAPGAFGAGPFGKLAIGFPLTIYGVTSAGGAYDHGVLFRLVGSSMTVLHHFQDPDVLPPGSEGAVPSGVAFGSDGKLYGTTRRGGTAGRGTVFRLDGFSTVTFIHSFDPLGGTGGSEPVGDLTLASDGNLYGATYYGGVPCLGFGCGTVFRITPGGVVEVVHAFTELNYYNGVGATGGLTEGAGGKLYGIWSGGTLYSLTFDGAYTPLHRLSGQEGNTPNGNLLTGFGGHLYGTTRGGGANGHGTIFRWSADGTFTTLHAFEGGAGGRGPVTGLARRPSDGHLFGTTQLGGTNDVGLLFRVRMPAAVDVTANGLHGPVALRPGEALQIGISFYAAGASAVNPTSLYLALVTPGTGVYWLTPTGFGPTPGALYTGFLFPFAGAPLLNIPDVSGLPSGNYWWIFIISSDATGLLYDVVLTSVP